MTDRDHPRAGVPRELPDDPTPVVELATALRDALHEARTAEESRHVHGASDAALLRTELQERERKQRQWHGTITAIATAVITVLGGGGVYAGNLLTAERVGESERKIRRLGERSVEQEIQLVEGVRFLSEKIDRAHPEARDVRKPEAVEAGERRVDDIKRKKRVEQLLAEPLDADDPLKDTGP